MQQRQYPQHPTGVDTLYLVCHKCCKLYYDNITVLQWKITMMFFQKNLNQSVLVFKNNPRLYEYTREILEHPEFKKMNKFRIHKVISREKHLLNVTYYAVKISPLFFVDKRSVARAAMLHDFFPYQRTKNYPMGKHCKAHPRAALAHAEKFFDLNDKERNTIICHMWPVVRPFPKYREAIPVIISDKISSYIENYYERVYAWMKADAKKKAKNAKIKAKNAKSRAKNASKRAATASRKKAQKIKTKRIKT